MIAAIFCCWLRGANFTAVANITITANASDSDGSINRVDFYQGNTLIGTATTTPYSINWNNVPAGSYSLTAKATDNLGAQTDSTAVSVTVNAPPTVADIRWIVTDQLGTPRMVFDQTGSLANVSRHDYLPFGEELTAGTGGRTPQQGYSATDGVRQHFTQKERDIETGLDYFLARYYSSTQGRFTSVDPENAGADPSHPQSWNGYAYAWNKPTVFVDPDGQTVKICDNEGRCTEISDADANKYTFNKDYAKANGFSVKGNKDRGQSNWTEYPCDVRYEIF